MIAESGRNLLLAAQRREFARLAAFVMSDPPYVPRPMLDVLARERIRNHALEERMFQQRGSAAQAHAPIAGHRHAGRKASPHALAAAQ